MEVTPVKIDPVVLEGLMNALQQATENTSMRQQASSFDPLYGPRYRMGKQMSETSWNRWDEVEKVLTRALVHYATPIVVVAPQK